MDGSSADLYTVSVQIWADTSRIGRPSADTPATADLQRGISSVHGMALPSILQVVAATTVSTKCYVQQFESSACDHQCRNGIRVPCILARDSWDADRNIADEGGLLHCDERISIGLRTRHVELTTHSVY